MNLFLMGLKKAVVNFQRSNSFLWVNSLCYLSILSVVPLFALAISFGRWLGIDEYLQRIMYENSPFDRQNVEDLIEISQNLLETARGGIFTGIGFLFLGWSLITMFACIEKAFNSIWNVKKPRNFIRKATDYTAIFLFLLFLILATRGVLSFCNIYLGAGNLHTILIQKFFGYIFLTLGFTALYVLVPNTKVKFIPAFISGILTAFLFGQMQIIVVWIQGIIISYNKIYGSFSIILIFLIWVQFLWTFILLGAHLCCLLQNKSEIFSSVERGKLNFISRVRISLDLLFYLGDNYLENEKAFTLTEISHISRIPHLIAEDILNILRDKRLVAEVILPDEKMGYKLVGNIDILTLGDIWEAVATYGETYIFYDAETQREIDEWLNSMDKSTLLKHIIDKKKEIQKKIE